MSKLTKNQKLALGKIEAGKAYTLKEASALVKEITTTKFDASVDVDVRLGVDPRKANQMVRGVVSLPHGTGKQVRVLALCTPDKEAEATAADIDKDGWFHTGDAGYLKDGQLYLTERIKDLFKTSNGKYVSPQALETKLAIDRYIDQIAIIADQRKFVSALIVPVYGFVKDYAKEKGIEYENMEELLQHPKILGLFRARIDTLQQQFAHYEQVKRFTLLPEPFSMERGELTNTLKLKRSIVAKNYKEVIDKMYEE